MAENEIKFVVSGYEELETALAGFDPVDIEQGYLNANARVRRLTKDGEQRHYFTYKQRMPNGHNLELPPGEGAPISAATFDEAWPFTQERVIKRRVSLIHIDVLWDIDFYRWSHPYFVLAEAEMPPNMERPKTILPALQGNIVYEVPRDDGRFAARLLANEEHVKAVAKELGIYDGC